MKIITYFILPVLLVGSLVGGVYYYNSYQGEKEALKTCQEEAFDLNQKIARLNDELDKLRLQNEKYSKDLKNHESNLEDKDARLKETD